MDDSRKYAALPPALRGTADDISCDGLKAYSQPILILLLCAAADAIDDLRPPMSLSPAEQVLADSAHDDDQDVVIDRHLLRAAKTKALPRARATSPCTAGKRHRYDEAGVCKGCGASRNGAPAAVPPPPVAAEPRQATMPRPRYTGPIHFLPAGREVAPCNVMPSLPHEYTGAIDKVTCGPCIAQLRHDRAMP